eukprot:XP_012815694.1 PREDICTED: uncharacterized protein LOC100496654 isoform X1 [Xenopus tropicalis]
MSGLLLICSVLSLWGAVCGRPGQYCADQPSGLEAFAGDSVTFPCSFVFPRTVTGITNVTIIFQAGIRSYCGDRIYNSGYGNTTQAYQGRVSLVGDPRTRNGTITLTNVTAMDIKYYCCRVQLLIPNKETEQWQNGRGTRLTVRGENDMTIHQPPFIPALVGDTVTIPCHFSISAKKKIQKMSLSSVQWSFSSQHSYCGTDIYNSATGTVRSEDKGRMSLAGEGGASIQIKHVGLSDSGWYCCGAQVTEGGHVYISQKARGTKLIITGKSDKMKIEQPKEVTFPDSPTISCNYTLPENEDPLWVGIYWMFGDPREGFAYHPDPELIHPRYRGKTRLVGQSDLYLEEVNGMDNSSFYCRVAMRLCDSTLLNAVETLLEEGAGTLLRVNVAADQSDQTTIIAASVGSVIVLILLILIILCLIKRKGTRKQSQQSEQMDPVDGENADSAVPESEDRRQQKTDIDYYMTVGEAARASSDPSNCEEQLVYSALDHSRSSARRKSPPDPAQEELYADVKSK